MSKSQPQEKLWTNAVGHLVPESIVKPIDKARDQLVRGLMAEAKAHSETLARFKAVAFEDIQAFIDLSAEQYEVTVGGAKGNVTLLSFDGRYKILRQVQQLLSFGEQLQFAKQLIDECVVEWSEGARPEIKAIVNDAFQVNAAGEISTSRVLGLKRLNITDAKWMRAMAAIADSINSSTSATYIRFYERIGETDQYRAVSLDLAAL